ncbi:hypothetical protein DBR32_09310 [Taibaiella sp. KBW10]|uniref:alpha/beta hydrolase n=1 Tax=Taibaiella sp. KBW10 TaxID=2153357 RepID=UPI000F5AE25D|nr:alpha/beta hydrolase [Taibaiella sp. KBW10]RQO30899.1 hypothetical protein DBR32_09310 [Taibaiella sp. KBW10]
MPSGTLSYQNNKLHFVRYGTGKRLLLAFHGSGQDASFFAALARKVGETFTIIAPDLPEHGKTSWRGAITKVALITLCERFKVEFDVDKFSLLGYGIGSRFVLTLAEQRSEWIDGAFLWAAADLQPKPWYGPEARNPLGKRIFRQLASAPETGLRYLSAAKNVKLLKKSNFAYMKRVLENEGFRKALSVDTSLTKNIVPELDKVRWQLKKYAIPTIIYIPADAPEDEVKQAEKFIKKLPAARVEPIPSENLLDHIASQLKP